MVSDQELRFGRGRTRLDLGKMAFKRLLQFGDLDSSVTVGSFGYLHRRRLQPPQDILHRVGGLNRREVLGQITCVRVIHPVDVVDGRAANRQPEQADQGRWRHDLSQHGSVSVGSLGYFAPLGGDAGQSWSLTFAETRDRRANIGHAIVVPKAASWRNEHGSRT